MIAGGNHTLIPSRIARIPWQSYLDSLIDRPPAIFPLAPHLPRSPGFAPHPCLPCAKGGGCPKGSRRDCRPGNELRFKYSDSSLPGAVLSCSARKYPKNRPGEALQMWSILQRQSSIPITPTPKRPPLGTPPAAARQLHAQRSGFTVGECCRAQRILNLK